MKLAYYMGKENEHPLEHIPENGGFCGIFRKIACIGDSLSSGEFESRKNGVPGYHDFYDYSWGQFLARDVGCAVYNFSRGGMTAEEYCEGFADSLNFWDISYGAHAYIIALGVNDMNRVLSEKIEFGSIADVDVKNWSNNKKTFAGYYAQIIQRYQEIQPDGKFFLMTLPRGTESEQVDALYDRHAELIYEMQKLFPHCYVLDFRKDAPVYDKDFHNYFWLGHMTATGYRLTALMVEAYIDYIIRHNAKDFKQIGFIGTPYTYEE